MSNYKLCCIICLLLALAATFSASVTTAQVINSGTAFQEVGLPTGTPWAVMLNGTQYNATENTITISLSPGIYNFSVVPVQGYTADPQSGTVTAYLDPIKITTVTFSSTIPEFTVGTWVLVVVFLLVAAAALTKTTLREHRRRSKITTHASKEAGKAKNIFC